MAGEFMHTGDVVEAVISVLRGADDELHTGGLPANWFTDAADDNEVACRILQHGDLADYPQPGDVLAETPMLLVRGLGTQMVGREVGGWRTIEPVRIIHIRRFEDCRTDTGAVERNMARARERYSRLIHRALFNDPHRRLGIIAADGTRTEAAVGSTPGASAQVYDVSLAGWDLGYDASNTFSMPEVARWRAVGAALRAWCVGAQLLVRVTSTG